MIMDESVTSCVFLCVWVFEPYLNFEVAFTWQPITQNKGEAGVEMLYV